MNSKRLTKQNSKQAFRTTLLICLASVPFWILIALQIILFRDDSVGFWLKAPHYYPFSFAFAQFVALSCGTCVCWAMQQNNGNINLLLVIAGIFVGSLFNIAIPPYGMNAAFIGFLLSIVLLVTLLILKHFKLVLLLALLTSITFLSCNFISFLPIINIYLVVLYTERNQSKPFYIYNKTFFIPALAIIIIPYIFAVFTNLTPGLILPIGYRHSLGNRNYPFIYQYIVQTFSKSQKIEKYIGTIREYGLAEGRHYEFLSFRNSFTCFITEIRGERGTAFVDGCDDNYEYFIKEYKVRAYTKLGKIDFIVPK